MDLNKLIRIQQINEQKTTIKSFFESEKIKADAILIQLFFKKVGGYFTEKNFQLEHLDAELLVQFEGLKIRFITLTNEQLETVSNEISFFLEINGPVFISYVIKVITVSGKFPVPPDKFYLMDEEDVKIKLAEEEITYFKKCIQDYKTMKYKYSYEMVCDDNTLKKVRSFRSIDELLHHIFKT